MVMLQAFIVLPSITCYNHCWYATISFQILSTSQLCYSLPLLRNGYALPVQPNLNKLLSVEGFLNICFTLFISTNHSITLFWVKY